MVTTASLTIDAEFYETYRRVVELRPDVVAQRRQKILNVFRRLIASGVESGEFAPVDCDEAATVLNKALHPSCVSLKDCAKWGSLLPDLGSRRMQIIDAEIKSKIRGDVR